MAPVSAHLPWSLRTSCTLDTFGLFATGVRGCVLTGGGSQDAVLTGIEQLSLRIDTLSEGQQFIQEVVGERLSLTRQASKIKEADLLSLMAAARCCVLWDVEDPTLESLLGPAPEEGTPSW